MFETTKTAQVLSEMKRYHLDILGISESHWTSSGCQVLHDGSVILHSGHENTHTHGVAILISKEKAKTLLEWEPVSERLIRVRLNSKFCKLTILQCYAPTKEAEEEVKEDWYEQLQMAVSKVPQHDVLLLTGDMNAKVGNDNSNNERAMGRYGCGERNNNGERLVDFCTNNNLVIGGTIFPHKNIHKLTWQSPDGRTINQIDHIIINGKWRRSLQDVRAYRGADAYSDHYLIVATIKLKLKKSLAQGHWQKKLDIAKLQYPKKNKDFVLELRNRFSLTEVSSEMEEEPTINSKWNAIKTIYSETAQKVLGFKKKGAKEWISASTWQKVEERKQLKAKMLNSKSQRLLEKTKMSYKNKDREVKRSARRDKRVFVEHLASEAEKAAAYGKLCIVYKITSDSVANVQTKLPMLWIRMATSVHQRVNKQPDGFNTSTKCSPSLSQNI